MSSPPQVVITGVGVVSPIGIGKDACWRAMLAADSGVAKLQKYDLGVLPFHIGAEILDFQSKDYVKPRKAIKLMCDDIQVGFAAAGMAVADAGLEREASLDQERFGVVFGGEMMYGPPEELTEVIRNSIVNDQHSLRRMGDRIKSDMFPLWMLKYLPNMIACHVGIAHQAHGPNNTVVQGEASSLLAISEAASVIERGWADIMISGGMGNRLNPTSAVYRTETIYSRRSEDPAAASRPFDAGRDGQVFGEGSAAFVLESRKHAQKRGANILGSIAGYGSAFECRQENQEFAGDAIRRAMQVALQQAGIPPNAIDHINAHGLSTPIDDRVEARAIRTTLGDVPVTAPKSLFGNLGAGGGAVELVATVLGMYHRQIPPTRNFVQPDPDCPVNVIHGSPQAGTKSYALKISQSNTGQSAAIVIAAE